MFSSLRNFTLKARPVWESALGILFPPCCPACGEAVAAQGTLCAACWKEVQFITEPMCQCCGLPFAYAIGEHGRCGECLRQPPAFTRGCSVLRYDAASRGQVLAFKFQDRTQLAPLFANWLTHAAARDFIPLCDVIVPVPLYYWRLVARRYNQAALLAAMLATQTGLKLLPHSLRRKRATPAQSGLSRKARVENVRGAFIVPRNLRHQVRGKTVLLVDDVMTTGATLSACARALRDAGAKDIYALTLARTVLAE